jgi:hypothetical protein
LTDPAAAAANGLVAPGLVGPTATVAPTVCMVPGAAGTAGTLGLLLSTQLTDAGRLNLLRHGLLPVALGRTGLRASLRSVIATVRDLARQATNQHQSDHPSGADPPLPTPGPAPMPTPPTPEQSSGSFVQGGSHGHHKGGGSYAILAGVLLVLCLRPLLLARLARSTEYWRSVRPLALPG